MRKICVVVTARPSYSRIKTALDAIRNHPFLELQLVVAASALLERYGKAIRIIEKDNFPIAARVFNVLEGENLTAQAKTTGLGILELSSVLERLEPDAVVTIADRFETMATAISAAYMNIPLIHIQGGEVTGNIDEKVRHAITKLSDLHFVASEEARQRVIKMGENPHNVINTGCPSIDLAKKVMADHAMDFDPLERYGGVGKLNSWKDGYIVVLQHPVTTEYADSRVNVEETLKAISSIGVPTFWFWPNVDAGADGTSKGIRAFRETHNVDHIHFFKNMDGMDFLKLLYNSKCIVGNSSVGIRECAFLGVPCVNIGTRQNGRERGHNVIDVPGYNAEGIVDGIRRAFTKERKSDTLYGNGGSGEKIASFLATCQLDFKKRITY